MRDIGAETQRGCSLEASKVEAPPPNPHKAHPLVP
jgi:hypothetical protein